MNILTINAEDWYNGFVTPQDRDWQRFEYRVEVMLRPMLDELDRHGVKAVVFCTGWLAEQHPEVIREVSRRGHRIGCNGYWHEEPNRFSREEFAADLMRTKCLLEEVSGQRVEIFRAPNFAIEGIEEWFFEVLQECGFQYDSSMKGQRPYSMHGIKEYPVAKYRGIIPFSGGGFFRLMPYLLIKRFMLRMEYVMTYFHPRDFDAEQPRWPGLSMKDKFLSYVGVKGAFVKYRNLLNDFKFKILE